MALATYSDLVTAVQDWLGDRDDLATKVPDFISLAEARMNRKLRTRSMETSTNLTPSSGVATLPSDYLEWRSVTLTTDPRRPLIWVDRQWADRYYGDGESGTAQYFTINGSSLQVYPVDSTVIELRYYATIAALTAAAPTNWLFTKDPRTYLNGALTYAAQYMRDWDAMNQYGGLFEQALDDIEKADKSERWSRTAMRIQGQTP